MFNYTFHFILNYPEGKCIFCELETYTRKHHLLPKCMGGKITVPTCVTCENFIHATWSHKDLDNMRWQSGSSSIYDLVPLIQKDEKFQKFLKWRLKQNPEVLFKSDKGKNRNKRKYS